MRAFRLAAAATDLAAILSCKSMAMRGATTSGEEFGIVDRAWRGDGAKSRGGCDTASASQAGVVAIS